MNLSEIKIVFLKELKETLRDQRTLLLMILMPVIFYPVLLLAPRKIINSSQKAVESKMSRIAFHGDETLLLPYFREEDKLKILSPQDPEKAILSDCLSLF